MLANKSTYLAANTLFHAASVQLKFWTGLFTQF